VYINREKRREDMSLVKGKAMKKSVVLWVAMLVMLMSYNLVAMANDSPDVDYETDSAHILISAADTSIADIAALSEGDAPADVLKDKSLEGYSTLAVFSVTAIDDYDFSDVETTVIKGATITEDMDIQVRFLPDAGAWESIDYTVSGGTMSVQFEEEGHLAIFAKDEIAEEETSASYKKSPQTGDYLPFYILAGLAAAGVFAFSVRKIVKR
jgi:hypothetical protein